MIVVEEIDSAHLAKNLVGNPSRRPLAVYLPPSYRANSDRRYPSAYVLHGFSSRATTWIQPTSLSFGAYLRPLGELFDEAIAAKRMAEMVVVMPDGNSAYGCPAWVDSPVAGEFEQYVTREVVSHVDRTYRTIPSRDSRGITGHSAGGMGSWHIGSRNPDVFGAMAPLAMTGNYPWMIPPIVYRYFDRIYPGQPNGPIPGNIDSWFCYGWGNAFSPNPARPPFFCDFPFEYPSGALVPEVWERWLQFDPATNWKPREENLRRLRGIMFDVGSQDEFGAYGQRILSRGLTSAGIGHDAREHTGGHTHFLRESVLGAVAWMSDILELSPRAASPAA
ncbi:MAG: hypothetical protein QOH08_1516 [Chloroflexota bacterium]|jgi:S-formylglutathione hydrolase FrmB|nr:hypothetical protein [Chloroflexota bacterium]